MKLPIEHTWDGQPIGTNERAELTVTLTAVELVVELDAPFHDDPPPGEPPGHCDDLWNYEVVELFLVGPDGHYLEVEIGPHGHHLVLLLDGVRSVERIIRSVHSLDVEHTHQRWRARLTLPRSLVPNPVCAANAFAIWSGQEARRYLAHYPLPGPAPDFHQPSRFPTVSLSTR